ncbi:polysaccharide deacetylase family protein [Megasphaera coli]|uniref:polysaccharide deacetylase family protein n=1 Tax=Colibacter massiliensis TaxID=1852379 RepID=UPI00094F16A8|nr:polysaccharide deacetylase family protein [Colibacter massiliensis]
MKKICTWILGIVLAFIVLLSGALIYWYFASTNYHLTGMPVLNYHQVNNKFHTVLTMKPENFEEQIRYLSENGYHSITLEQFEQYMEGNTSNLPDRPILITFDDGYVDNYEYAYPILKKYNMVGTIFLITDFVGRPGYLNWDQVKEMSNAGMEFGSHTLSHRPLDSFNRADMRHELVGSKKAVEWHLNRPCDFIAFPEGKFTDTVLEETQNAGYKYGFTIDAGRDFPWDNPYDLDRIAMFEGPISFEHFRFRLTFSAFSAFLWKTHKFFEHMEFTKPIANCIPEP